MTFTEHPDLEQRSNAWYEQRRGMVTASAVGALIATRTQAALDYDCPTCQAPAHDPCKSLVKKAGVIGAPILTLHSARTAVSVERRDSSPLIIEVADNHGSQNLLKLLVAERITGYTDPTWISADMWRGIEDEPRARDHYSEHHAPVRESGFMVRDDWGFKIGYSPDGLVGDDGLIEVKSRLQKEQVATVLADKVPLENMAQLQCGLLVSGRKWIDYVSYCGGTPLYVKRVTPDQQWVTAILEAVEAFELTAADMVAAYNDKTEGLALTERAPDPYTVELKL